MRILKGGGGALVCCWYLEENICYDRRRNAVLFCRCNIKSLCYLLCGCNCMITQISDNFPLVKFLSLFECLLVLLCCYNAKYCFVPTHVISPLTQKALNFFKLYVPSGPTYVLCKVYYSPYLLSSGLLFNPKKSCRNYVEVDIK